MNLLATPWKARGGGIVPEQWRSELREVLIPEAQLRRRVAELARAITRDCVGADLVVVALLSGTIMFLADLLRHLKLPLRLDFIGVASPPGAKAPRAVVFHKELRLDVAGRDVLVVADILDSGRTLASVLAIVGRLKPRMLRTCVLLEKAGGRRQPVQVEYTGFLAPDVFVVGYGLDYQERYRNLPFVGVLRPELCRPREA